MSTVYFLPSTSPIPLDALDEVPDADEQEDEADFPVDSADGAVTACEEREYGDDAAHECEKTEDEEYLGHFVAAHLEPGEPKQDVAPVEFQVREHQCAHGEAERCVDCYPGAVRQVKIRPVQNGNENCRRKRQNGNNNQEKVCLVPFFRFHLLVRDWVCCVIYFAINFNKNRFPIGFSLSK